MKKNALAIIAVTSSLLFGCGGSTTAPNELETTTAHPTMVVTQEVTHHTKE